MFVYRAVTLRELSGAPPSAWHLDLGDGVAVYLVWAVHNPHGTLVRVGFSQRKVITDTSRAVRLDGPDEVHRNAIAKIELAKRSAARQKVRAA